MKHIITKIVHRQVIIKYQAFDFHKPSTCIPTKEI